MIYIIMTQPWFKGDAETLVTAFDDVNKMKDYAMWYNEKYKSLSKFDYYGLNLYKVKPGKDPEKIGSITKEDKEVSFQKGI